MKINGKVVGFEAIEDGCWITNPTYDGSCRFKANPVHEYGLAFVNSDFYPMTISEPQAHDDAMMYVLRCLENSVNERGSYTFTAFLSNLQLDVASCKNPTFNKALLNVTNNLISSYTKDWDYLDNNDCDYDEGEEHYDDEEPSDNDYYGEDTPANIHRTVPASLYSGIDKKLLRRIRPILENYYTMNEDNLSDDMANQIIHDIDVITKEIGDEPAPKLTENRQNILMKVIDQTIQNYDKTKGLSIDEYEQLETLWTWVAQQSPVPNEDEE